MQVHSQSEYETKVLLANAWKSLFGSTFHFDFRTIQIQHSKDLAEAVQSRIWLRTQAFVMRSLKVGQKRTKTYQDIATAIKDLEVSENQPDYLQQEYLIDPIENGGDLQLGLSLDTHAAEDSITVTDLIHKHSVTIKIPLIDANKALNKQIEDHLKKHFSTNNTPTFVKGIYTFFKEQNYVSLTLGRVLFDGQSLQIIDLQAEIDNLAPSRRQSYSEIIEQDIDLSPELGEVSQNIDYLNKSSIHDFHFECINPSARFWIIASGCGASLVMSDSLIQLRPKEELGGIAFFSGSPNATETDQFVSIVLSTILKCSEKAGISPLLLFGGATSSFIDIADACKKLVPAFERHKKALKARKAEIVYRRGGPNHEIGLNVIKSTLTEFGIPIRVYGPKTPLSDFVRITSQFYDKKP